METPLHAQKVAILSRLVKEQSITLEEALLLLKEEEQEKPVQSSISIGSGTYTIPCFSGSSTVTYTNTSGFTGTTDVDLNS
jgi:hypothetical protein